MWFFVLAMSDDLRSAIFATNMRNILALSVKFKYYETSCKSHFHAKIESLNNSTKSFYEGFMPGLVKFLAKSSSVSQKKLNFCWRKLLIIFQNKMQIY